MKKKNNLIISIIFIAIFIIYIVWYVSLFKEEKEVQEPKQEVKEEEKYRIHFDVNGGNGNYDDLYVTYESMMPQINKEIPTREGYDFIGWYDNPDYNSGSIYYSDRMIGVRTYDKKIDTTLYAGWRIKTYTITYNPNDGSNRVKRVSVDYNSPLPDDTNIILKRDGYEFMGWYNNPDYNSGELYYSDKGIKNNTIIVKSDLNLFAGWKEIKKINATCNGLYENKYGFAKLDVKNVEGDIINYQFMLDNKIVQEGKNPSYRADNEYVLLINPKVKITSSDNQEKTIDCNVSHSNYLTYNPKGYYFHIRGSKDVNNSVSNPYTANNMPYYLHIPTNISPNEKLPLIVGLHGGYGIGRCFNGEKEINTPEAYQTYHYFKNVYYSKSNNVYAINNGKDNDLKAVILTISNTRCSWNGDMLSAMDIIHAIVKTYNIDLDRVYLTGGSQGGAGTLYLGFLEEQILYRATNDNTTLDMVAKKYNTTVDQIVNYNKITKHNITYSDRNNQTLKRGSVTIVRSKNNTEQRSLFALLMPFSPAQVDYRISFVNPGGGGRPPHVLKTPIWVFASNDERQKVVDMGKEVTTTYDKLGDVRYTLFTGLRDPHDSDTAFFNRTSAAKWLINQTYGNIKVKNNNEISSIERQMGNNFYTVWRP